MSSCFTPTRGSESKTVSAPIGSPASEWMAMPA